MGTGMRIHVKVEQDPESEQLRPLRESRHDALFVHPGAENSYLLPQELRLGVVPRLQTAHGQRGQRRFSISIPAE